MCESAVLCLLDLISKIFQRNYSCLNPEAFNIQYKNCQNTYLQEKKTKMQHVVFEHNSSSQECGRKIQWGYKTLIKKSRSWKRLLANKENYLKLLSTKKWPAEFQLKIPRDGLDQFRSSHKEFFSETKIAKFWTFNIREQCLINTDRKILHLCFTRQENCDR